MDRIALLRAFVRVADTGSFTAAATELRVKQSTVSKWIHALEEEMGQRLIDRTTRSQRVTDAGARLLDHAGRVIEAYDEAVSALRPAAGPLTGHMRVSLPTVYGERHVMPAIVSFLEENEQVSADLVFGDRYVSLVEEGFDLVIRIGLDRGSTLRAHTLSSAERRLVAAPAYLRTHGTPRAPRDLRQHTCLVHTPVSGEAVWTFRRGNHRHRARIGGRVSANNSAATAALARAGMGIALLASWLVDDDVEAGRLETLLPRYSPPPAPVRALTAPGRHVPPRVRALIDHLRAAL